MVFLKASHQHPCVHHTLKGTPAGAIWGGVRTGEVTVGVSGTGEGDGGGGKALGTGLGTGDATGTPEPMMFVTVVPGGAVPVKVAGCRDTNCVRPPPFKTKSCLKGSLMCSSSQADAEDCGASSTLGKCAVQQLPRYEPIAILWQ